MGKFTVGKTKLKTESKHWERLMEVRPGDASSGGAGGKTGGGGGNQRQKIPLKVYYTTCSPWKKCMFFRNRHILRHIKMPTLLRCIRIDRRTFFLGMKISASTSIMHYAWQTRQRMLASRCECTVKLNIMLRSIFPLWETLRKHIYFHRDRIYCVFHLIAYYGFE